MQDHALVRSLQSGRVATFAVVYDLYAKSLHGYCSLLLGDRTEAEAALRDTFLVAELRIDELGDPARLKPWLFAIARGEAARRRTASGSGGGAPEPGRRGSEDDAGSPAAATHTTAPRSMAETAVAMLDSAEREALELAERHGLAETDVAVVLDLSVRRVHTLLTRARQHLREALTAVILVRTGREQCRRLAAITGAEGRLDAARCRRVRRHTTVCGKCGRRGAHRASAAKLLTILAPAEVPAGLRRQILNSYNDPALIGYRLYVARRVGALDPTGFPRPVSRRRRTGRQRAAAAATCVLVAVAGVLAAPWFRSSEAPHDPSFPLPGGQPRATASHVPSPVVGRSAPVARPSPSPIPLGARPAAAEDPVLARSMPAAPIAAAVGAVRGWGHGDSSMPSVDDGHSHGTGRSGERREGSGDGSSGGSSGSSGRSPSGWEDGAPSGSPDSEPSQSQRRSATPEPSSEPASTGDETRARTPSRPSRHSPA